jgi:outer membrane biosynthesis protein TonB
MPEQHPIAIEVDHINSAVAADTIPQETASALAAQSMAQSLAIATADATALLRNVETTMSTVQAAALTRWIEAGSGEEDPRYQVIVRAAAQVTADAVALWRDVNTTAQQLLESLVDEGERSEPAAITVEAAPSKPPVRVAKQAPSSKSKKKAAKKAAAKKAPAKKAPAKKAAKKKPSKPRAKKTATVKPVPVPVPEAAAASNE